MNDPREVRPKPKLRPTGAWRLLAADRGRHGAGVQLALDLDTGKPDTPSDAHVTTPASEDASHDVVAAEANVAREGAS